jgi:hypothetical protein
MSALSEPAPKRPKLGTHVPRTPSPPNMSTQVQPKPAKKTKSHNQLTIPTIEDMKTWDAHRVLWWICQHFPELLKLDDLHSFRQADIIGRVFLASDAALFQSYGVSRGRSLALEDLVKEVKECSKFIPST